MSTERSTTSATPSSASTLGMPPWAALFWGLIVAGGWWRAGVTEAGRVAEVMPALGANAMTAGGLHAAGKLAGFAVEALFYRLLWGLGGRALPLAGFFGVVMAASLCDVLAFELTDHARRQPDLGTWYAVIAGPQTLGPPAAPWQAVFGSVGLLLFARLWMTAAAQTRGVGAPLRVTVALTAGVWLGSRLVLLLLGGLLRGMSPGGSALG